MAMNLDDLFTGTLAANHQSGMSLIGVMDRNLVQGFGVILESVVQAQASVSDDSGLISALQTASRVPRQGSNDDAKA